MLHVRCFIPVSQCLLNGCVETRDIVHTRQTIFSCRRDKLSYRIYHCWESTANSGSLSSVPYALRKSVEVEVYSMGRHGDPLAVLDARMRVRGVSGLRVSDMSAVPEIPAGNTNAPAMILGDRYADLVL